MTQSSMIDIGGAMARLTLYGIRTKVVGDRFHMMIRDNDWSTLIQHDPATSQILVSRRSVDKFIDFVCQELKPVIQPVGKPLSMDTYDCECGLGLTDKSYLGKK